MTKQASRLAIGQVWRCRNGNVVIVSEDNGNTEWPILANGAYYSAEGRFARPRSRLDKDHPFDPVELISPAPTFQPMPSEIPEPIRTGAAPFYVLMVSDDSAKEAGNPIIWETVIPQGCTLQAVLQQQRTVGSRYGTTHIAECRIIPELTQEVKE